MCRVQKCSGNKSRVGDKAETGGRSRAGRPGESYGHINIVELRQVTGAGKRWRLHIYVREGWEAQQRGIGQIPWVVARQAGLKRATKSRSFPTIHHHNFEWGRIG